MNITNITVGDFGELINLVNTETGGLFGAVVIIMLWSVAFMYSQKRYTHIEAAFISTFLTFIPVLLMTYIGLFSSQVSLFYMLLMASLAVLMYLKGGKQ